MFALLPHTLGYKYYYLVCGNMVIYVSATIILDYHISFNINFASDFKQLSC